MAIRVFILGRPGSGKSSIAQQIYFTLQGAGWHVDHLYDYKLLQERFLQEIYQDIPLRKRKFQPRGPEPMHGFDVIDFSVLEEVLLDIANQATRINVRTTKKESLLLIEFARNNYQKALSLFGHVLLRDAHILYIETDLETCIRRIDQRIDSHSEYGHYVSHDIMWQYYYKDDWLVGQCQQYFKALEASGIRIYPHYISNKSTNEELSKQVERFIRLHLLSETETIPVVQNTEAIPIISPKPSQIESVK